MSIINLTVAEALARDVPFAVDDQVTIVDDSSAVGALTASQLNTLAGLHVDGFNLSDDAITLGLVQANAFATAGLSFDADDTVTIADFAPAISALSVSQIQALGAAGVDTIYCIDESLSLTAARAAAFAGAGLIFEGSNIIKMVDTGSAIASLTADQIGSLVGAGFDTVDVSNNAISLTVAQAQAFAASGLPFASNDVITLADSGEAIASMSDTDFADLAAIGVTLIDAVDNTLGLSLAQLAAIKTAAMALTTADTISLADTSEAVLTLSASDLAALKTQGVDRIDLTDDAILLTVAQAQTFVTAHLGFASGDQVMIADIGAHVAALTSTQLAALKATGVDGFDLSNDAVGLTVAQAVVFAGAGLPFDESDVVTIADTGSAIAGLSTTQIATLAGAGFLTLDATTDSVTLTVAKANAIAAGGLSFDASDTVTVVDTGTAIATLGVDQIQALAGAGITTVDSSTNALSLSLATAQAFAEAGIGFATGDVITLAESGGVLAGLSGSAVAALGAAGVTVFNATDNALGLSLDQIEGIEAAGITLTAADSVKLLDSSDAVIGLSPSDLTALKAHGVDIIDLTDDAISLSVSGAQAIATAGLVFAAGDEVTVVSSGAAVAALTAAQIAGLKTLGVDTIDLSDDAISLSVAQANAIGTTGIGFAGDDVVTLADSGVNIAKLTAAQIASLGTAGVTEIDSSTGALVITVAQAKAFLAAGMSFADADLVKLVDTGAAIATLGTDDIAALGAAGVDSFDASNNIIALTVAEAQELVTSGLTIATGDVVTLVDTGDAIAALTAEDIVALKAAGVDAVDSSTNLLTLSLDRASAYAAAGITLSASDAILLADTGANVAALTAGDITALKAAGFDGFDLTDNALTLTIAKALALGSAGMHFSADDVLTVQDTGAALAALSTSQIAALKAAGIDAVDASDNALTLNVAKAQALLTAGLHFTAGDVVTVLDTGSAIGKLTTVQLAGLASVGVDGLDASTNAISLTAAQYHALGTLTVAANDTMTVTGVTGVDTLVAAGSQVKLLGLNGNDFLAGGAITDVLSGGAGNDHLAGGGGADTFLFDTKTGATNVDIISAFTVADDTFAFDKKVFTAFHVPGVLDVTAFHIGTTAADASDRVIYDDTTGALYYDSDGAGGKAAVKIATLDAHLTLTHDDFLIF